MAKLFKDQLDGILDVLSVGFINTAAVKLIQAHINELDGDIKIRDKAISEMQKQIDQAREDERRAVAAADRLKDNVIQLNREKRELEEKLEAADELVSFNSREEKKVVLPRKVAEAIEHYRSQEKTNFGIVRIITSGQDKVAFDALRELERELRDDEDASDILMSALVNGYIIEETPTTEDKIRYNLTAALNDMNVTCPVPVERLAKVLTHAVREVLAEDRQAETQ